MKRTCSKRWLSLVLVLMLCMTVSPLRIEAAVTNPGKANFDSIMTKWNGTTSYMSLTNSYKGAKQCAAFSRYTFTSLYGHDDRLENTSKNNVTYVPCQTAGQVLAALKKTAARGDAIRISRYYSKTFRSWDKDKGHDSEKDTHIMILQDIGADGAITVYESNTNGKNNKARSHTYSSAQNMADQCGRKTSRVSKSFNKANERVLLKIIHAKENKNTSSGLTCAAYTIKSGTYTLAPKCAAGMRLDISGASKTKGANAQIWTANASNAQKFTFTYLNNGYYRITSKCSGLSLDVYGGKTAKGTNVQQWTANSSSAQQWKVTSAGEGYYYLTPRVSTNLRLDVSGAKNVKGTNVQVWTANSSNAQKWKISTK